MHIPSDGKQKYIEAYSHSLLAKEWGVSLITLDSHAKDNAWDIEHKLYWQDVAIEVLKKGTEEHNYSAVKELLKAVGITRPVGRPPKSEVDRHIAIEAKIAADYQKDVERLSAVYPLKKVK
ncbi:hypothetical protein [Pseudomonas vranovensis]|uniref:hypothetical protein n=1 Tax=Pseudomonas vranovensis TaxID=321661 RepID=UPI003D98EC5D